MDISAPLSDLSQINKITCYHEAGHAVMARLLGRQVYHIAFVPNVENTYNGGTVWGREEFYRDWDPNVPYAELGLQQRDHEIGVVLVIAAGKAAERIYFRLKGLEESLANFGFVDSPNNDEYQLEEALKGLKHPVWQTPRVKADELPSVKQQIEDLAVKLLEHRVCWQAVEVVAETLFKNLQEEPGKLTNAQAIIAEVFEKAALEEKKP